MGKSEENEVPIRTIRCDLTSLRDQVYDTYRNVLEMACDFKSVSPDLTDDIKEFSDIEKFFDDNLDHTSVDNILHDIMLYANGTQRILMDIRKAIG